MNKDIHIPFKFIGIGSAFNPDLGNNNVFLTRESDFLLIDCGGLTFSRLLYLNLLEKIKNITIIITHTHTDHVGSLSDLLYYTHYKLSIKPNIIFPDHQWIRGYLKYVGIDEKKYSLSKSTVGSFDNCSFQGIKIKAVKIKHVDTMPCYAYYIEYDGIKVYYSGDSCELKDETISMLESEELDRIYQDTCGIDYEGNVHMYVCKLEKLVKREFRHKVYCMHLDKYIEIEDVKKLGFNVVEVEDIKQKPETIREI